MEAAKRLQGNSLSLFSEGIGFVLLRWSALRDAVENQWGGPDSRLKADNLATDILSWFTQSREPLDTDDLEDKLYDGMTSLNVVVEAGSIKEVAKNLMVMHEECLEGNFVTIERYRQAIVNQAAHPRAVPQVNDSIIFLNEMMMRMRKMMMSKVVKMVKAVLGKLLRIDDEPLKKDAGEAEDGWVVVSKKKNKVRKN
ncbi:pre-rRNA-processing protein TSR2-like [Arachis stenosperma]|uniref:pre-rRNA-processing protein TSR2-like n=1 Tax=Arachis stenosperma TaxID=217475 RepID=UPI0025ACF352|nr:pre-rRNA-processing protein TSR2-like [Arachis stenosperma]